MGSKQLNDEPINMNPVKIQKQIRDNASDVECYLKELNNWSSEMKAKELAESGADLVVSYLDK
jgi:sulfur relay (sulfurtransferase) DsrC/TusE family protein